jgi:hypothetical protein
MKRTYATAMAVMAMCIYLLACSKDGDENNTVDCNNVSNKSFAADVNPIIQSSCNVTGCHATGSTNGPGPLTNYTQVFNARTAIRTAVSSGTMPKASSLPTSQKNSIICWIDSGAPNN